MSKQKTLIKILIKVKNILLLSSFLTTSLITIAVIFFAFDLNFINKINPGVYIAGNYVGGLKKDQVLDLISKNNNLPQMVTITYQESSQEIILSDFDFQQDLNSTVERAFQITRTGNIFHDFIKKISLFYKNAEFGIDFSLDEEELKEEIETFTNPLVIEPILPEVELINGRVVVEEGKKGIYPDNADLRARIGFNLAFLIKDPLEISFKEIGQTLTETEKQTALLRAKKLFNKELNLSFKDFNFKYDDEDLINLIDPNDEYDDTKIASLILDLATQIDREPKNSVFVFESGRVTEFTHSKDGYKIETDSLKLKLIGNLRTLESDENLLTQFDIPVIITPPEVKTGDVNDLGIKEIIGVGKSRFLHSITNRIYNIGFASEKFRGTLVAPGEVFSFNSIVGDISKETGFKQAYIIKEGKTILGDGGGVCQVSTTLFRAALDAGLPILERQAHAYRVSYYEQGSPPGIDATVYAPHPDLKFKNDTSNHILIQPIFNRQTASLNFEIYGTSDGRKSFISKPIVSNVTPPPEDLYVDDPTLPTGQVKQIDYKAWGAKVKFDYKVKRNGQVIYQKTFYSNYQPWQAIFLRGTAAIQ